MIIVFSAIGFETATAVKFDRGAAACRPSTRRARALTLALMMMLTLACRHE
jgi:hypothetical protein